MSTGTTRQKGEPEEHDHHKHRKRLKKRFEDFGLDNFEEHNALELLLFYAQPRKDVNPLAHRLMKKFGSLAAVFDAPIEELVKLDDVGKHTALLIKLIPEIYKRYVISGRKTDTILNSTEKAGEYLKPIFMLEREEIVYILCLDAKCKVITGKVISKGTANMAEISIRKIVETALLANSASVIISHNHTNGIALPSRADLETTRVVQDALRTVGIVLTDHIIVAEEDYISMADNGFF